MTIVYLVAAAPWILALPAAINGVNTRWLSVAGMFGSVLAGAVTNRIIERAYWNRSWPERQRIAVAVSTGQPTGVGELDAVVLDRLLRASRYPGADRVVVLVLACVVVLVPVVAALRTTPWWLVALVGTLPTVALLVRTRRLEDPRVRLARFRAELTSAQSGP
ncbi:hypothetical protein [Nakamurella sp.]|uniref:hypothetical protein n=1 Tax=Nakamurella sp. TaxID=1869182 RepID=UPI003782FB96